MFYRTAAFYLVQLRLTPVLYCCQKHLDWLVWSNLHTLANRCTKASWITFLDHAAWVGGLSDLRRKIKAHHWKRRNCICSCFPVMSWIFQSLIMVIMVLTHTMELGKKRPVCGSFSLVSDVLVFAVLCLVKLIWIHVNLLLLYSNKRPINSKGNELNLVSLNLILILLLVKTVRCLIIISVLYNFINRNVLFCSNRLNCVF